MPTPTLEQLAAQVADLESQLQTLLDNPSVPAGAVVNDDGSITLHVRLRFLNPFDINNTGVGTITVLPDESISQFLPLLGRGLPGLAPTFAVPVLHEVPHGTPLPDPPITLTLTDPGDPNAAPPEPPVWRFDVWLHAGPTGAPGTPVNLGNLGDVVGTPVDTSIVIYRAADGKWHTESLRVPDIAVCTSFDDASGNDPEQLLGSLTFPAKPWARRPLCQAQIQINPASDTSNGYTRIKLIARLGDVDTGAIIANGAALETNQPYLCNLGPVKLLADPAAIIAANTAGIVYLKAKQTNGTLSNWSTTCANDGRFIGLGVPLV